MEWLKRHLRRGKERLVAMDARSRMLAGAMGVLVLAGGIWLVCESFTPAALVVADESPPPEQLEQAKAALDREGIRCDVREGKLRVARDDADRANRLLRKSGLTGRQPQSGFQRLAGESGLWRTQAQEQRQWQALKMAELSRLIAEMEPLESASVLLEPGSRGTLGGPARKATAAVKVTLARGRQMVPALVVAIAELVSGSVAGLAAEEVRIVDHTGRSYRAGPDTLTLARRHAAEEGCRQRIHRALRHIRNLTADVQVGEESGAQRIRAWVSVPRSWLGGDDKEAAERLAAVHRQTMRVLHITRAADVTVTWHQGVFGEGGKASHGAGWGAWNTAGLGAIAGAALAAVATVILLRRRTARAGQQARGSEPAAAQGPCAAPADLARERPQALAVILGRLDPEAAADILAKLPPERRLEVADRMADPGRVDPQVAAEIESALSGRLAEGGGDPAGPFRPPVFDDIVRIGSAHLREALETVEADELAISLRTASRRVKRRVLSCLAARKARELRRRMDRIGPVRLCRVESAQWRVLEAVRGVAQGSQVSEVAE